MLPSLCLIGGGRPSGDGAELHRKVAAEKWGVTKADLKRLRRDVWKAVKNGSIVPTELDPFDPRDDIFGPSIYTINEQYIKPVTAEAGNMSWALMKHPKGLKVDLFVTHAWQEGIFEFIDKVLTSWPRSCQSAWCCMLANPQNLDISSLISCPKSSPFALALRVVKCMLVVPNRRLSIYTRLWCAYEAHLAYEWNKVVLTASASPWASFHQALPAVLLCVVLGGLLAFAWPEGHVGFTAMKVVAALLYYCMYPLVLSVVFAQDQCWYRSGNLIGAFLSGHYLLLLARNYNLSSFFSNESGSDAEYWHEWRSSHMNFAVSAVLFFVFSELDRIRYFTLAHEASLLKVGYSGSIKDAACSSSTDCANIWAEINGEAASEDERSLRVAKVDETIRTLIRAGMSSRSLRQAVEEGVCVDDANSGDSIAFMLLISGTCMPNPQNHICLDVQVMTAWACLALTIILWIVFFNSSIDRRIFCKKVFIRVILIFVWPPHLIFSLLFKLGWTPMTHLMWIFSISSIVGMSIILALTALHIGGVARIPRIGPWLAQLMIARGPSALRRACKTRPVDRNTIASSDDSSEDEGSSDDLDGSTDDDPQQASLEDRWRENLPTGRASSIPQV